MAHELCHIAHIGFKTKNYEEIFAYQTSESGFRRKLGGLLRTTADTYLLLGSVIALLIAQVINITTRPPAEWNTLPMPLIYGAAVMVFIFISARYMFYWQRFKHALRNLSSVFTKEHALPVLFRCSDEEIKTLAKFKTTSDISAWLCEQMYSSVRWQIIMKKYAIVDFCARVLK